jgi:hypothetical protein
MQKWIQPIEKHMGHLDYTELITQIYRSNNFLPNIRQMSQKKQKRIVCNYTILIDLCGI